jgi:hypothetical protein
VYFRAKHGLLPPFSLPRLHEHIQFYTEASLSAVLRRAGFTPVEQRREELGGDTGLSSVLLVLARLTK